MDMIGLELDSDSSGQVGVPAPPPHTESMDMMSTIMSDDSAPGIGSLVLATSESFVDWTFRSPKDALDSWFAFLKSFPGLPCSCQYFLAWMGITFVVLIVHATAVLIEGGSLTGKVDALCVQIENHFYFYGTSQLLLALLALRFAVSAIRRENGIEIACATLLVIATTIFDASILISVVTGNDIISDAGLSNITCGPNGTIPPNLYTGTPVLFDRGLRIAFVVVLSALSLLIYYYGRKAGIDFGWRIFKLCGTNTELKRMCATRAARLHAAAVLRAHFGDPIVACSAPSALILNFHTQSNRSLRSCTMSHISIARPHSSRHASCRNSASPFLSTPWLAFLSQVRNTVAIERMVRV